METLLDNLTTFDRELSSTDDRQITGVKNQHFSSQMPPE
jgi:hypothetical protein